MRRLRGWLGLHVHQWGKWFEFGTVKGWPVQQRKCETCGKSETSFG